MHHPPPSEPVPDDARSEPPVPWDTAAGQAYPVSPGRGVRAGQPWAPAASYPSWSPPEPQAGPRPADPIAVAAGNASLLGVGYLVLGRKGFAVVSVLVTAVLVWLLCTVAPFVWFEGVVVLWWVALVAHGWVLARGRRRPGSARTQRLVALAVTVPVLLAFGLLRFDAAGIEQEITRARADGDCGRARAATDELWAGHTVADAPLVTRAEDTAKACQWLTRAGRELDAALAGDADALRAGFGHLSRVLAAHPGHERMAATTLAGFLEALPVEDPCDTKVITDWLTAEKPRGAVLGAAADIVPGTAPRAILACADGHLAANAWQVALDQYRQLLDRYPDHELAPRAAAGAKKATQAIELANVRTLLGTPSGALPAYCATPAPYSGARPYVPNAPNRSLVYGNAPHTGKLPKSWLARDAADAVVVLCAGETQYGTPVQTCPYESKLGLGGYRDVTFHKIAIPVRLFELRTGRLVADFKVEIGGASCPPVLHYTTYSYIDTGPPSQVHVTASPGDVQAAFRPLLVR